MSKSMFFVGLGFITFTTSFWIWVLLVEDYFFVPYKIWPPLMRGLVCACTATAIVAGIVELLNIGAILFE